MTNALFIDIDGTLITNKDGKQYLPPSAVDAMRQIRAGGGRVYLCTGRSLAEARTIGEVPIDGIIGAAGGFVLDGNTMVSHKTLGEDAVRELEELLAVRCRSAVAKGPYAWSTSLPAARSSPSTASMRAWPSAASTCVRT